MSGNSPVANIRYKDLTDLPNANSLIEDTVLDVDHLVIAKYASTSARDIANPTPVEGDECYVNAAGVTKGYYCYSGSAWIGPTMLNQAFQVWTTTWSTSSGSHTPTIGNGTMTFRYSRIGSICFVNFAIVFGTTTNFNSGTASDNWQWTLPYNAVQPQGQLGYITATNASNSSFAMVAQLTNGSNLLGLMLVAPGVTSAGASTNASNGGVVDAVTPFTWTSAATNTIKGQFFYEV